jgi:hypothetical protein
MTILELIVTNDQVEETATDVLQSLALGCTTFTKEGTDHWAC